MLLPMGQHHHVSPSLFVARIDAADGALKVHQSLKLYHAKGGCLCRGRPTVEAPSRSSRPGRTAPLSLQPKRSQHPHAPSRKV